MEVSVMPYRRLFENHVSFLMDKRPDLYLAMLRNRVTVMVSGASTATERRAIWDWLNKNCEGFFHIERQEVPVPVYTVLFEHETDMVNFTLRWVGPQNG